MGTSSFWLVEKLLLPINIHKENTHLTTKYFLLINQNFVEWNYFSPLSLFLDHIFLIVKPIINNTSLNQYLFILRIFKRQKGYNERVSDSKSSFFLLCVVLMMFFSWFSFPSYKDNNILIFFHIHQKLDIDLLSLTKMVRSPC